METKPYGKHQLYKGNYPMEGGEVKIPGDAKWVIKKYRGDRQFSEPTSPGEVVLILEENYKGDLDKVGQGFWPVISFLTKEEVRGLIRQLLDAVYREVK